MSLKNHWYIATTEAAARKKPQAVQLFGQHYVVFHTQNNQYAALLDCCPHRNVPLSGGKTANGNIECPYHGWQFDGAGKLAHIPATPCTSPPPTPSPKTATFGCASANPRAKNRCPFRTLTKQAGQPFA